MPFRSETASYLVVCALGLGATSSADVVFSLSGQQVEEVVKIMVQIAIGAVTVFNLLERRKRAKNKP